MQKDLSQERQKLALLRIISEMVECPAGTFMMGSPESEYGRNIYRNGCDYEKQHKVAITSCFKIGMFPVTVDLYEAITRESQFVGKNKGNNPICDVSYDEAREFCLKLNSLIEFIFPELGRLIPEDYRFDLPTEAQWEYACRAGSVAAFNSNENIVVPKNENDIEANSFVQKLAWYSGSQISPWIADLIREKWLNYYEKTEMPQRFQDIQNERWAGICNVVSPVGQLEPNAWGIYDMHGNVREWVRDEYISICNYSCDNAIDPEGDGEGDWHILRGGCHTDRVECCRSAARYFIKKDNELFKSCGFRIALVSEVSGPEKRMLDALRLKAQERESRIINEHGARRTLISALNNNKSIFTIKRLMGVDGAIQPNLPHESFEGFCDTPLTAAAGSTSHPEIIKMLVKAGENLHDRNEDGYNPLQCAAFFNNNLDVLKALLKVSSKEDFYAICRSDESEDALHLALLQNPNTEMIKALIDYDPNPLKDKDYFTKLLSFVAAHKHFNVNPNFNETVDFLIEKGAEINKTVKEYKNRRAYIYDSALFEAIRYNEIEAVKKLLDCGADVNQTIEGENGTITPLMACLEINREASKVIPFMQFLLENGADAFAINNYGYNVAMLAAKKGALEELEFLVEYNKELLFSVNQSVMFNVLNNCVINHKNDERNKEYCKIICLLHKSGVNININDSYGQNIIVNALKLYNIHVADWLIGYMNSEKIIFSEEEAENIKIDIATYWGTSDNDKVFLLDMFDFYLKNGNGK